MQATDSATGAPAVSVESHVENNETSNEDILRELELIKLCFSQHEFGIFPDSPDGAIPTFDYDPLQFINDKLEHGVALSVIQNDLATYARYLQEKITQHVNTSVHAAFVEVSSNFAGMSDDVQYLQRPLGALHTKITEASQGLSRARTEMDRKLETAVADELADRVDAGYMQSLLLHDALVSDWEVLQPILEELCPAGIAHPTITSSGTAGGGKDSSAIDRNVRTRQLCSAPAMHSLLDSLESFLSSTAQLRCVYESLPDVPDREAERRRIQKLCDEANTTALNMMRRPLITLATIFCESAASAAGTAAETEELLARNMQMYADANLLEELRAALREGVLRPALDQVVSWKAATQARQSVSDMVALLSSIEQALRSGAVPLVQLTRRALPACRELAPVSTILWPAVCEVLIKKLVSLYEVGVPDAFHAKYTAAYRVLSLCENCCASAEELAAFRQSTDLMLWNHKWNVDVYAALRCAAVEKHLTAVLDDYCSQVANCESCDAIRAIRIADGLVDGNSTPSADSLTSPRFMLPPFESLCTRIRYLFSDRVFLRVSTPAFLKQAVQSTQLVSKRLAGLTESGAIPDRERTTFFVMLLLQDLAVLTHWFTAEFASHLQGLLADDGAEAAAVEPVVRLVVDDVLQPVSSVAKTVVVRSVVSECEAAVQNVRSVRSAYSHTRKPMPSAPSWYVAAIAAPVETFVAHMSQLQCPRDVQASLTATVAARVCESFCATAADTLLAAKKTEESWEKLRRKKEEGDTTTGSPTTAAESTDGVSDRDKMVAQLGIDAKALLGRLVSAGGDEAASQPVASMHPLLSRLIPRAEWLLNPTGPKPPDVEIDDTALSPV